MTKIILIFLLSAVLTVLTFGVGRYMGIKEGREEGVRDYHALCYFKPRIMIDEENGFAVGCGPLGKIPKEELENYKDKV